MRAFCSCRSNLIPPLARRFAGGNAFALGRIDGLDCRTDTPSSAGFDSRALQPQRLPLRCANSYATLGVGYRSGVTIRSARGTASCGAPFFARYNRRMRIALGSDMAGELPDAVERWLRARGYGVRRYGALAADGAPDERSWTAVGRAVGEAVAGGQADCGILCCWTGTGVSIAANKVPGVRAALCGDPQTAAGAREWNDANVLCLSLRATSAAVAEEMLAAWFAAAPTAEPEYRAMIDELRAR